MLVLNLSDIQLILLKLLSRLMTDLTYSRTLNINWYENKTLISYISSRNNNENKYLVSIFIFLSTIKLSIIWGFQL